MEVKVPPKTLLDVRGYPLVMGERKPVAEPFGVVDELAEYGKDGNVALSAINTVYNWCRRWSFWPCSFGLACCAMEMVVSGLGRYDIARFGAEMFRASPRQADLLIVSGTITKKMAPAVMRVYDQMPGPKFVMAMGACACQGGPFVGSYSVVMGADQLFPVDVYIPGCPPRPDALLHGLMTLQERTDLGYLFKREADK
ncbi:MAG: NADH-quinone oxidoreductase subunit NuoB [Bacteroidetes bacterium]|nr:NADH-quinone oxidoreductase subunit NuoB [Bacteroidota bacterium]